MVCRSLHRYMLTPYRLVDSEELYVYYYISLLVQNGVTVRLHLFVYEKAMFIYINVKKIPELFVLIKNMCYNFVK